MAIAFDTSAGWVRASANTQTRAYTCTGSSGLLYVGILTVGNNNLTSVQYGGINMTQIDNFFDGGTTVYTYYLLNPATGGANLVIQCSGTALIDSEITSYTGVGSLDSHLLTQAASGTTASGNTTVVSANCWLIAGIWNGNGVLTAGTNCTLRVNDGSSAQASADSNGTVGTGSQTMSATFGGSAAWKVLLASFAPPSVATAKSITSDIIFFN